MVRAWPGGFGNSKVGANYGPSIVASAAAAAKGFDQILWLFGKEGWVTEAGACNFFAIMKEKGGDRPQLITAPLEDQVILPGVTRASVLETAQEILSSELDVVERKFTIHDLIEAVNEGRLVECFACGTAFFIAPIGEIHYKGQSIEVPLGEDGLAGEYAKKLKARLGGIMHGEVQHPWGYKIEETGPTITK
jgi:branched-chain amino acid aminotransferase